MMNYIWGILTAAGIAGFMAGGEPEAAMDALTAGAGEAVELMLTLSGGFMLWMGLMNVAKEAGLITSLGRVMRPVISWLMPDSPSAVAPVTLNLAANFFGLGSAATPFGLEAMREMALYSPYEDAASDDMCMFIALNASAIELLPVGVLTLRAAAGSEDVYSVVLPTFIASLITAALTILLCRALRRKR